jgi:cytochrome c2
MGVLTYKGATAKESLASENVAAVPEWAKKQGFENNDLAIKGATLFAQAGCENCHTYLGTGSSNVGAPDLSEIGADPSKDVAYFQRYVGNPAQFGNQVMPPFLGLGEENLKAIGTFLSASKGEK